MPDHTDVEVLNPDAVAAALQALRAFADDLTGNFAAVTRAQPEDQLKSPVAKLVKRVGGALGYHVVTRTEVRVEGVGGRPDLGVEVGGVPAGNIELKRPGYGAQPHLFPDARSRDQWQVFRSLPNLIYTDGVEWALYRSGELAGEPFRLAADPTRGGGAAVTDEDGARMAALIADFLGWEPVVPATAHGLAGMLAPITRVLRDEVLADVRAGGVMGALADEWRATLFPDADAAAFADGYAQTFTYALLLARLEGAATPLTAEVAAAQLQADHALLAQTLLILGQREAREAIGMPVGLLERLIGAVDADRLRAGKDPWLYFYEDFLAAYDPAQRNNRGVYFTPLPVVECQVRLAHHTISVRFGEAGGFGARNVVVLDPATGTGTYLLAVAKAALDEAGGYGAGVAAEVASTLAVNLNGFELLVGPYAVTHLRLSRALTDAGATIPADGVNVFLTDTLSTPVAPGFAQHVTLFQRELAKEQERASHVKSSDTRVTVVIGNPPYDRDTTGSRAGERRKGGMVRYNESGAGYGLIQDFRRPLPTPALARHGLNLFNDYVYFWRWAIWKVCEQNTDPGIVSFITPASYLTGPGFAGMREVMRRRFDEIWLIDLGGEGRGTRRDDNVFDGVLSPVVIGIGIRLPGHSAQPGAATVRYRRFEGSRDRKFELLDALTGLDPADPGWAVADPGLQDPFTPAAHSTYAAWPQIGDVFPWTSRGIQFSRTWPVSEDGDTLTRRWQALTSPANRANQSALLHASRDADPGRDYPSFLRPGQRLPPLSTVEPGTPPDGVERVAFRSFDRQWCIADRRVIDMPRPPLWAVRGPRQIFFTTAHTQTTSGPGLIANAHPPDLNAFNNRGGLCFPLYRDAANTTGNLPAGLTDTLSAAYNETVTADDVAAYVYGLLGTGAFTRRYSDDIAQSGIRVPFTADPATYTTVRDFGYEQMWWATFAERSRPAPGTNRGVIPPQGIRNTTPVPAGGLPDDVHYDPDTGTIHVGTGTFGPVSPQVWGYEVSGLKVVQSWLNYRRKTRAGRSSSDLDKIRPARWNSSRELVELLSIITHLVDAEQAAEALLDQVVGGPLIPANELPQPSDAERRPPRTTPTGHAGQQQFHLDS